VDVIILRAFIVSAGDVGVFIIFFFATHS